MKVYYDFKSNWNLFIPFLSKSEFIAVKKKNKEPSNDGQILYNGKIVKHEDLIGVFSEFG